MPAKKTPLPLSRAVFLDRDGVINRDTGYVCRAEQFELLPGVIPGLSTLQGAGFALVVVTNQSGIGRGYYSAADYEQLNRHFLQLMTAQRIQITDVLHCPHAPEEGCDCRKPRPGMILEAARRWHLDLGNSYLIGDGARDIEAGKAAGLRGCVLLAAAAGEISSHGADAVFTALPAAAEWILRDRDTGSRDK